MQPIDNIKESLYDSRRIATGRGFYYPQTYPQVWIRRKWLSRFIKRAIAPGGQLIR